jgi:two-component system response regulator AtoC
MKYLMCYFGGFIKKFPLNKPEITIGRSSENDITIKREFISRRHARIKQALNDHDSGAVTILDLNSTNGILVGNTRVREAVIKTGESFTLGRMEFYLKEGDLEEFEPAPELLPIFRKLNSENKKKSESTETTDITEIYNDILKEMLHIGLKKNDFNAFTRDLSENLSKLTDFGTLFLVSRQENDFSIAFSINGSSKRVKTLVQLLESHIDQFSENVKFTPVPGSAEYYCVYPVEISLPGALLVYIAQPDQGGENSIIGNFLLSLSRIIELLSRLQTSSERVNVVKKITKPEGVEIIGPGKKMQDLVEQARKIADSDIFVLIQGESGTGKELFARLIHKQSKRCDKPFMAINCAAIPENLLESELFGYEKGAFTGAYNRKKGILELVSGGILVLDEVGDMPLNLQAKLLRALQENEFYRLGGNQPIKVDLRIIALTNQNLKHLIKIGKFREDLYYRLVHRTLTIPPLRERREDIPELINFFSRKCCALRNKSINGCSVKAFEFLLNHDWKGNVRQLENEIKSLVDLCDDGEMITYDMLSDEVKGIDFDQDQPTLMLRKMDEEEEKAFIISLLEKNQWNKSQTARALGMTYRGLHKKLCKWGISRPNRPDVKFASGGQEPF